MHTPQLNALKQAAFEAKKARILARGGAFYFCMQKRSCPWLPWDFTMNVNSFANVGFGTVHDILL